MAVLSRPPVTVAVEAPVLRLRPAFEVKPADSFWRPENPSDRIALPWPLIESSAEFVKPGVLDSELEAFRVLLLTRNTAELEFRKPPLVVRLLPPLPAASTYTVLKPELVNRPVTDAVLLFVRYNSASPRLPAETVPALV